MTLKEVNKLGVDNCSPDAEKSGFGMISFKPSASDLSEYWLDLDKESAPLDFLLIQLSVKQNVADSICDNASFQVYSNSLSIYGDGLAVVGVGLYIG